MMTGLKNFTLSAAILLFASKLGNRQEVNAYNVGLVEYLWDDQVFPFMESLDLGNRNAKIYSDIVGNIKKTHDDLDLVVFPEGTLVSEPLDTPEGRKGMTFVPKADANVTPCNSSSTNYTSYFKLLSCTAQKYRTYLVINLKEKDLCQDDDCSSNQMKFYNTDVVFDRNGKVIARYRKYHLYLEPDTNRPVEPELVTFDTDFGESFGIFTCFDLIYDSPANELVRRGVKNFIFPTLWIPELPFHTTIQIQQMWAQGNDVTLLTAGAAYPTYGSGGLGIFLGGGDTLAKVVTPRTDNFYLFGDVTSEKNVNSLCTFNVDDKIASEMDKYNVYVEDLTEYNFEKLTLDKSKIISERVCQVQENEIFCCDFNIAIDVKNAEKNDNKSMYDYFLIARSGLRTYGNKTYQNSVEVCALVACTGPSIKNCGQRFPDYDSVIWPVTFKSIKISAKFPKTNGRKQFPNSLLADFSPIPQPCTTWKTEENTQEAIVKQTFKTRIPVKKLLTYAIFGRNYDRDVKEVAKQKRTA